MTDDLNLEDIKAADEQPAADPAGDKVPAPTDDLPQSDAAGGDDAGDPADEG